MSRRSLIRILQQAYSGELAAAYAYRGHWKSVSNLEERRRIQQIEAEEWHHRRSIAEMLRQFSARPQVFLECKGWLMGRALALLCHLSGWFAPMYTAGRLESHNICEYRRRPAMPEPMAVGISSTPC